MNINLLKKTNIFIYLIILIIIILLFIIMNICLNKKEGFTDINVLVIISSHVFNIEECNNIKILNDYLLSIPNIKIDYCGITNDDEYFKIFEDIITFKYKIVNTKLQLGKICDFINDYKTTFDYNYFIKIRPDIKLLEQIPFNNIDVNSICSRARIYKGPEKIKYGLSVNSVGPYEYIDKNTYMELIDFNKEIVMDDQFYIFTNKVINMGAFNKLPIEYENIIRQDEWVHTKLFNERNIPLKIIGLNVIFTKNDSYSGDINYT